MRAKLPPDSPPNLSPRLHRLLQSLLEGPQTARDLFDAIPCNNPSAYVAQARFKFELTIPCETVRYQTMDGKRSWFGQFSLTDEDAEKVLKLLN